MEYRMSPYRFVILALAIFAYAIVFLHRMSPTVMANPIMLDLGVSASFMGLLSAAYFYPYAVMQVPSGVFSDKISANKLMTLALAAMSIGGFIFAFAPSGALAFIGRLAIGVGASLVLMPAYKALSYWFTKKVYLIVASTVLAIAGGLGSVLAGMPLSFALENFGWRSSIMAISVVSLIVTALAFFFFKDKPQDMGLPAVEAPVEHAHTNNEQVAEKLTILEAVKIIVKNSNFWVVSIAFFVNSAIIFSFVGLWAGLYYSDVIGLSKAEIGTLLSAAAGIAIFTPIIFASFATKAKSRKNVLIFANIALFAVMLYLYLMNGSMSKWETYIWGATMTTVAMSPAGLYMATARGLFPENIAGTANGLAYSFCMLGAAIFQPLIGVIINSAGYTDKLSAEMFSPVALLYLVATIIATIACFLFKEKK